MPRVPYVGFGNDEIEAAPPISNSVECCPHCGREHEIKTAESESGFRIHVYTCPDTRSTYLAGVQGKRLGTPSVHGSVNMDDEPASPRDALAAVLLFYSAGHWTE